MTIANNYEVIRVLSNNVLLVRNGHPQKETILMGKGIGFKSKVGSVIDENDSRIEKKFMLENEQALAQYKALLKQIDPEVIEVSERIISMISQNIPQKLNEHIHLALPNHIEYALYRLRHGIEIENPFLWEIQQLNPAEYEVAIQAAHILSDAFTIDIPEDEIGFLAIHIVSASTNVTVEKVVQHNHLLQELIAVIERKSGQSIPKSSVKYIRLITHLRFAIERIREGKKTSNPLREKIKESFPDENELAGECVTLIGKQLKRNVSEDEVSYMTMDLYRLLNTQE